MFAERSSQQHDNFAAMPSGHQGRCVSAFVLFCLGMIAFGPTAERAFGQAPAGKQTNPSSARELYSKAAAALVSKDLPRATTMLTQLVEQHPEDEMAPLAAMRLAQCYMSSAQTSEAITVLEKWLPELAKSTKSRTLDPAAELDAQALLARAYFTTARYDRVIQLSQQLQSIASGGTVLSEGQRRALDQVKSFATAATQRREANQAGPLREAARLTREKRFASAQAELDKVDASLLGPDWKWRYHVLCAQSQLGQGHAPKATEQLNLIDLNRLQPKEQAVVRTLRMEAALASGALSAAEKELDALSTVAPADPEQAATLELRRTELALLHKDRQAVERMARAAKEKYPNFSSLHEFDLMLARNLLARIEFDEARQILYAIIDHAPATDASAVPRAQWLLGESYLLSQDYPRAISEYCRVIENRNAGVWTESSLIQRAKCYELVGQPREAQRDYERLATEFPNSTLNADAKARLSQLGVGQGNLK